MNINITVSVGELIDKITILEIKMERISDDRKKRIIAHELSILQAAFDEEIERTDELNKLIAELKKVNESLWDIEDEIRVCERKKQFDQKFIELARAVYYTNDRRHQVK